MSQENPLVAPSTSEFINLNSELHFAYTVIMELRLIMSRVTNYDDIREYYWTLLFEFVYRAGRAKERQHYTNQQKAGMRGTIATSVDPDDRLDACMIVGGVVAERLSSP